MDRSVDLDTRRLRVFLTLVRELHFSRAARLLHISQSALSQQVRTLERELGTPLFTRTSRLVELTAAGRALAEAAPRALHEVDRAIGDARRAADGALGRLVVGSVRTGLTSITPLIMRAVRAEHPDLRLDVRQMDTAAQLRALLERRIDVGVVRAAGELPALVVERLVAEPLVVALPADHRLAVRDRVDPVELAEEAFVLWPRHQGADFHDIVIAFCREVGFSPRITAEGADIDTQLALVAAGLGVSLQPAYYSRAALAGVAFRPLLGPAPEVALQLAWRRDRSHDVRHFVAAARAVTADRPVVGDDH
jgi:DNA-binding transcriptional LysR family regulator